VNAESIYAAYPRKVAKIAALRAIERAHRLLSERMLPKEAEKLLMDAVTEFAQSDAGQRGQFTPHCSTFMNQGRYHDDRSEWYDAKEIWRIEPGVHRHKGWTKEELADIRERAKGRVM
jgi:hypothetical protein